jgi:FtsP/CotA-like multicopper oxidase with cupredoxin domain
MRTKSSPVPMDTPPTDITRHVLLQHAGACGLLAVLGRFASVYARTDARSAALVTRTTADATRMAASERVIDLTIDEVPLRVNGRVGTAIACNGTVPGPLLRLREGDTAVLRVTNRLREISSLHWHGLIVPPDMNGVPGISFGGIKRGETFAYRCH